MNANLPGNRLLIDAGNTRVKWAWLQADGTLFPGQPITHAELGDAAHAAILRATWQSTCPHPGPVTIWLCNVAGTGIDAALQAHIALAFPDGASVHRVVSTATAGGMHHGGGMRNGYRDPTQLGVDRWVSAIGAHTLWPDTSLLVVTAGTATTLDVITADGLFRGGMILPGLSLMAQSLARSTAQLPEIPLIAPPLPAWADNTPDAIALGCLSAQCGAVQQAWDRLCQDAPSSASPSPRCIVSGGAGTVLAAALAIPYTLHDNLVLSGLAHLAAFGGE